MPGPTKRVLIYRLGSLGDTLVALPSLHLVARAFPHAERQMLTNIPVSEKAPAAAAILDGSNLVHGYIPYPVATRNPLTLLALLVKLRLWRPDVVVYLAGARGLEVARRDHTFFRLTGAREIIGVPLTDDTQRHRLLPDGQTYEAECARLARNLSPLGDAHIDDPQAWDLRFTPAELARAAETLAPALSPADPNTNPRPILAVSLGTKRQCGDWEQPNWITLITEMAALWPSHALAILGAGSERDRSQELADAWLRAGGRLALNLCGLLTPRESGAALAHAQAFVGHDSGPMHLAAAVRTPAVAIFSARQKPGVWFPYGTHHQVLYHQVSCWGCNLETCLVEQKRCILSITVAEVLAAVEAILKSETPETPKEKKTQPTV